MNDYEEAIKDSVEQVRQALKTITNLSEMLDASGNITESGRKALEELEGLDLFWICDPLIKYVGDGDCKAVAGDNRFDKLPKAFEPPVFPKDGFIHTYCKRSEEKTKPIDIDDIDAWLNEDIDE